MLEKPTAGVEFPASAPLPLASGADASPVSPAFPPVSPPPAPAPPFPDLPEPPFESPAAPPAPVSDPAFDTLPLAPASELLPALPPIEFDAPGSSDCVNRGRQATKPAESKRMRRLFTERLGY